MDELDEKLRKLAIEDFIWLMYIFIIFMSWYSNFFERKYFIYNDLNSKEKYRTIIITIFLILFFIYLYFLKDSYDDLKKLNCYDSMEKRRLIFLSFIGSLLITISGAIFLYIAFTDEDLNVELAFN